ncbi:MAG TPA: alkaline phosphatase D family protein [Acidimicrobiales bacterium]|nr:alkaline phosphatase D family protein [Acidimicrobiales bacterium]
MTGDAQEAWLLRGLDRSRSVWDVVAQQTIFAEVDFNPLPGSTGLAGLFNVDQWDGYVAQRRRITEFLAAPGGPANPVVITGDIHSSWVADIKVDYDDPASPVVVTEFVGTSITSDFPLVFIAPVLAALPDNPHIKDFDGLQRGYVVCRLDRQRWLSEYRVVATIDLPTSPASVRRRWVVEQVTPGAQPA